ncbi:helix-turn-helix transcriptional regulator [Rubrivirga sp.]|uniref:AraC family transcriptional regulator n=1 Tax=Rubrivirga sp. TaxID=1885344 RepID=UPI003C7754F3
MSTNPPRGSQAIAHSALERLQSHFQHQTPLVAKESAIDVALRRATLCLKVSASEVAGDDPTVRAALDLIIDRLSSHTLRASDVYDCFPGSSFRRRFERATGKSVRNYIEDARLLTAMGLLQELDVEIYLIADSVGYEHYETFCRAFKRVVGLAPSEFRESIQ